MVRRVAMNVLVFVSWGLALYLFYTGNVLAGFGALVSVFFFAFGAGFGAAFAKEFGPNAIKDAKEEGRVEGRKESA